MDMPVKMNLNILSQLKDHGYEGGIISTAHLQDLKKELEEYHKKGIIAEEIYNDISQFTFEPPDNLAEAASLIVVAVPLPSIRVTFSWKEKEIPITIPPTYLSVAKARQTVKRLLIELSHGAYIFAEASLPEKLVAAHSGPARYGRNNITYVSGLGSFYYPLVFYSDLPGDDNWHDIQIMETCQTCSMCLKKCPTHAITSERFIIKADRCLTLHNEKPREIPFPKWIEPSWHNCLVGCMQCQYFCPENKNVVNWVEQGPIFSGEETTMLLQGFPLEELPSETVQKLTSVEMERLLDIIPRNLKVLLPI